MKSAAREGLHEGAVQKDRAKRTPSAAKESRLGVRTPAASGDASWGPGLAALSGYVPGQTVRFQVWYRDPLASPCGAGFNLSNALSVPFCP